MLTKCTFCQEDEDDKTVMDLAVVLFETATLRSGYLLPDTKAYGDRIERMLRLSLNIDPEAQVCALALPWLTPRVTLPVKLVRNLLLCLLSLPPPTPKTGSPLCSPGCPGTTV